MAVVSFTIDLAWILGFSSEDSIKDEISVYSNNEELIDIINKTGRLRKYDVLRLYSQELRSEIGYIPCEKRKYLEQRIPNYHYDGLSVDEYRDKRVLEILQFEKSIEGKNVFVAIPADYNVSDFDFCLFGVDILGYAEDLFYDGIRDESPMPFMCINCEEMCKPGEIIVKMISECSYCDCSEDQCYVPDVDDMCPNRIACVKDLWESYRNDMFQLKQMK